MFRGRTMQHFNRKTAPIFTRNWYQYNTHTCQISVKPTEYNIKTKANNHWIKKRVSTNPKISEQNNRIGFEKLLQEAIDEGFSMLGESAKKAIYFHLEKIYKMNRRDIPVRIEEFINAIEEIFGTGAKILEIQIMKCLFKKVNLKLTNYSEQKLTFKEYIAALKRKQDITKINTSNRIN
jgi:hypothetical protein